MPSIDLSANEAKKLEEAIENYLVHLHRQMAPADLREAREHLRELEEALHGIEDKLRAAA